MQPRVLAAGDPRPIRIALYSHDSVGLGHTRRNLALAHAFAEAIPQQTGRMVTGLLLTSLPVPVDQLPTGFDRVSVPAVGKEDAEYHPRHLDVRLAEQPEALTPALDVRESAHQQIVLDRRSFRTGGSGRQKTHEQAKERTP